MLRFFKHRRAKFGFGDLFLLMAGIALDMPADCADINELDLEALLNTQISTVSKYEQKASDAPASVTIITGEEIERYGYRTLTELLNSVSGFFIRYDRNYDYIGVRGFNRPSD